MKNIFKFQIVIFLLAGFCLPVSAVIIAGGDGSGNTNAPVGDQGWSYVGRISNEPTSMTYIDNNWFIGAYHMKVFDNPSGVLFGGSSYTIDPNSWTRMTNSIGGNADLVMFRVVSDIGLTGVTVRSSATANGSSLMMIGNGYNRQTAETHWWDLGGTWTETGFGGNRHGYKWASGTEKRWGTNHKDADIGLINSGGSFGITDMFRTDFDDNGGNQAQAAIYDSGGGVFYNTGSEWELVGIMLLVPSFRNQPGNTSVYGNQTYMADMQYYAAQITVTSQISDIDEDGIPDQWEYTQSGSTTGVVASVDQDGDGVVGEDEYIADTNPTDSNLFWQASGTFSLTNQTFTFDGSTARKYQVLYTTNDLADPGLTWSSNGVPVWGAGAGSEIVVTNIEDTVFYRVWVTLP